MGGDYPPGKGDVGNGAAGIGLNQLVGVDEFKAELLRNVPAHRRFARAHEADEREIDDVAVTLHGDGLAENAARRTPHFSRAGQVSGFW